MKNLIKNVIRSFKNNKISLIGLIFLLFFGLGAFCLMSNTTANISNQYNSIARQGNLHDFTASELYEIGNAAYITSNQGFEYEVKEGGDTAFTPVEKLSKLSTELYSIESIPTAVGKYNYIVPTQTVTTVEQSTVYTRSYKLKLDANASTGLYKDFAKEGPTSYTEFEIKVNETVESGEEPSDVAKAVKALNDIPFEQWKDNEELMEDLTEANVLAADYNYFLKGISERTNVIFNLMTSKDTPLTKKLDEKYSNELTYRQFKSINVTATKDNIFYKVINSNPTDTIDKIVLFKDPQGNYGNELFNINDWAPFNSRLQFYDLNGKMVPLGTQYVHFTVPTTFEELVVIPLVSHETMANEGWSNDEKFLFSQIVHIRFKRMYGGRRSTENQTVENIITTLGAINTHYFDYYRAFVNPENDIYKTYDDYIDYAISWNENIIISLNGNIVINWSVPTPLACTMDNWTSHFCIINPQHLSATGKHIINSDWFNKFNPFREWCYATRGYYPSGTIDQNTAIEWFNSLTIDQFDFWRRPTTFSKTNQMDYVIYNKDGTVAKTVRVFKGTGEGQWNGLPDESIASCGKNYQIIWGCGLSPDFMYPVVNITRPTPNVKTECLTYVNDAGYKALKLAFFNSPVEEFLIAKFMPSVSTTRQNQIIDELNAFCAEKMLYPKEIRAVYRANDTSNVLNSSAFRVSYIPNLVSVIQLVSIILCSFLGILALVICLIIIKRYVENSRINIGIMRANGISKIKIALSLFPFALFPALVGGIAAYLVGLFLQIPMLKLFGNYWTLPTPILHFDWISMVACIIGPFVLFGIVTILATLWVLRTKSVDLMKAGSEFKTNSFSKVAKKPFKHFGILTRFRVALAFNSLSRLIVLALMSCLTMTSLVFAMTSFGKLNKSQAINSSQFDYSYNLKLTTPTTVGGNYNLEDWSAAYESGDLKGLGYTNEEEYIYNVTWNTQGSEESQNLTKWYSHNLLTVLDLFQRYREAVGNNGNLMLPTAADALGQKQDLQYLMNKTCSKMTLDYVVGLGTLSSNPWEIALALMPANSRNMASDSYNQLVQEVGAKVQKADELFTTAREAGKSVAEAVEIAGRWYSWNNSRISPVNNFDDFFAKDAEGKFVDPFEMDVSTRSWLSHFSPEFAKFLVTIYTDKEIMKQEYRISYGIISTNWPADANPTNKPDELYTYITGRFKDMSSTQRSGFDPNHEITIEGIQENSKFIKLTDNNGRDLNKVLYEAKETDEYNWVIVNAFAAHKYNLGYGSTFSINMSNMADRYDREMHPEEYQKPTAKSNVAKFRVLAVSQGTNGEAFYCKKKPANQLLGLPDGESWNSTHKYMMWQDSSLTAQEPVRVIDMSTQGASDNNHYAVYAVNDGIVTKEETEVERFNKKTPEGFNGIYTDDKSGRPLTAGLSLYSYSGLYPGASVFNSDAMRSLLAYKNNLPLANFMTGINDPDVYKAYANREELGEERYISTGVQPFIDLLRKYFGDTTMVTCICGATDVEASDLIYKNLISTFNLAETSIMSVIIPITIIVVGIISNLIIGDSKKMAAMLKALGYSDKKNAASILALFVPTIVIGLALAIPASMGICIGYQALIFSNANILIDVSRKWWYYLASIGGIGIVLIATYMVGWASLKADKLSEAIKR